MNRKALLRLRLLQQPTKKDQTVSLNWKAQSGSSCFLVWYLITFCCYRGIKCSCHVCSVLPCFCCRSFQFLRRHWPQQDAVVQTGIRKWWAPFHLLQGVFGRSATSRLWEDVWPPLAGSGQLSFSSPLKSSQFSLPVWRHFSFFAKFQAEKPSQHLLETPGSERGCAFSEFISSDLTE